MRKENRPTVADVLRDHFPGIELGDHADLLLDEFFLLVDMNGRGMWREKEREHLTKLRRGIAEAWEALNALSPELRMDIEETFRRNARARRQSSPHTAAVWASYGEIVHSARDLCWQLHVGLTGQAPQEPMPPLVGVDQEDALTSAEELLSHYPDESKQQRSAETWARISLVENARRFWMENTGKAAPKGDTSEGPFLHFLEDLIEALGRDWNARSCLHAWKVHRRSDP
ncbi:hypothetical protein [Hansschlegelia beijingensis]|uniref:Uncharacterized protein n=1 Tax=Hansschlegelia beijingensis TaxID=1133344 RepID=A0A7W6D3K1_9HYPH|nr:hypothetical protein [Hansschlegelia beijingensis]MBB3972523.1 hypothetical protein [Hansschlegelia beijingensis]